jgi:hypothetical protein
MANLRDTLGKKLAACLDIYLSYVCRCQKLPTARLTLEGLGIRWTILRVGVEKTTLWRTAKV